MQCVADEMTTYFCAGCSVGLLFILCSTLVCVLCSGCTPTMCSLATSTPTMMPAGSCTSSQHAPKVLCPSAPCPHRKTLRQLLQPSLPLAAGPWSSCTSSSSCAWQQHCPTPGQQQGRLQPQHHLLLLQEGRMLGQRVAASAPSCSSSSPTSSHTCTPACRCSPQRRPPVPRCSDSSHHRVSWH